MVAAADKDKLRQKLTKPVLTILKNEMESNTMKYISKNMIKIRINAHATQDRAKNRECNITVEYVNELLEKQDFKCYYCNNKVSAQNGNRDLDLLSIDRVNSNQGHIIGNCVISCLFCNLAKNDCDESTFKKFIEAIKKNEITDEMKHYTNQQI
jgi:RNA binding exosome subunit